MTSSTFRCAVEEVNNNVYCYVHGASSWRDFQPIVRAIREVVEVKPLAIVEGPDMRVFEFQHEGHVFSLVCDDAWGHEIRMKEAQNIVLMKLFASRLQRLFDKDS